MQHGTERPGLALQVPAQALGHREDPLAHRQRRKDVVDQVRGGLDHAPGGAGRTETSALAGEGDQKVMAAGRAAGTGKAVGEDAAGEIVTEFTFHRARYARAIAVACQGKVAFQVFLHQAVEDGVLGTASAVGAGARARGGHDRVRRDRRLMTV